MRERRSGSRGFHLTLGSWMNPGEGTGWHSIGRQNLDSTGGFETILKIGGNFKSPDNLKQDLHWSVATQVTKLVFLLIPCLKLLQREIKLSPVATLSKMRQCFPVILLSWKLTILEQLKCKSRSEWTGISSGPVFD
jgi:hypothetical protein